MAGIALAISGTLCVVFPFLDGLPAKKRVAYFDALGMSTTGPLQLLELPLAQLKPYLQILSSLP